MIVPLVFLMPSVAKHPIASAMAHKNMGHAMSSFVKAPNVRFPMIAPILPPTVNIPNAVERMCVGDISVDITSIAVHPATDIPVNIHSKATIYAKQQSNQIKSKTTHINIFA